MDPALEIKVDLEKLNFIVLDKLFDAGEAYLAELTELKGKSKASLPAPDAPPKRKHQSKADRDWGKKGRSLRERQPW